ncbi:hypothetical protein KIW74_gp24 [Mycobacterium phage Kimona]|uniref:Uncharacterized protein n=1 Tax=Mycobacterium phage Kimona TaxID=2024295 RepID=A0A249XU64_9CAUD|nr:hypothetical protein KIW74_gp24 [Mycobacterium phage Kimona]ASZ75504.1 hypothetical protein PBI_KIMONA_68 [Mycobacterium phage Kimona]
MTTQLTVLALTIAIPSLLFAHVHHNDCGSFLAIFRSPVVKDTDPCYQPVADVLATFDAEVIDRKMFPDPDMFFGRAEAVIYKLREKQTT